MNNGIQILITLSGNYRSGKKSLLIKKQLLKRSENIVAKGDIANDLMFS